MSGLTDEKRREWDELLYEPLASQDPETAVSPSEEGASFMSTMAFAQRVGG